MGNPFSNLGPTSVGPVNVESQILTSIPVLSTVWTEILGIFRQLAANTPFEQQLEVDTFYRIFNSRVLNQAFEKLSSKRGRASIAIQLRVSIDCFALSERFARFPVL